MCSKMCTNWLTQFYVMCKDEEEQTEREEEIIQMRTVRFDVCAINFLLSSINLKNE